MTLALQILLFGIVEYFLPSELKYFSAYSPFSSSLTFSLTLIPCFLLISHFIKENLRPYFFVILPFIVLQNIITWGAILTMTALFLFLSRKSLNNRWLTSLLLFLSAVLIAIAGYSLQLSSSEPLWWLWVVIHVTWGLKLISWIVTVRIYKIKFSLSQGLEFFFHPAFFIFTNDLNVLTPRRFFDSKTRINPFSSLIVKKALFNSCVGLALIVFYGLLQAHYFKNLDAFSLLSSPWAGGVVSVATAILFHAANVYIQVSLFASSGYQLEVDMNKPWLAISPTDYWKRMHFYVREYVHDIIVKPIMVSWLRMNSQIFSSRILIVIFLYFLFTFTQVGYQPYRQSRSFVVGLLATGIFVAMFALPEMMSQKRRNFLFHKRPLLGRILTFGMLYVGYVFIFKMREGF